MKSRLRVVPYWQQIAALVLGGVMALLIPWLDWVPDFAQRQAAIKGWIFVAWLGVFPFAWLTGRRNLFVLLCPRLRTFFSSPAACFVLSTLVGIAVSAGFGWKVRDLPPLYQDEYSYLFGAQTLLAGRVAFPPHALATFFDQMHVLNDTAFASKYFIGTGLFLAPSVALGVPYVGGWITSGLLAGVTCLIGMRFSPLAGWLSGMMVACAPGVVTFANLLLSTHPSTLAVVLFLWATMNAIERDSQVWTGVAGIVLGFGMLTRPATMLGITVPLVLYCVYRALFHPPARWRVKLAVLAATLAPFAAAQVGINVLTTGEPFTSPHGWYTATRTPSHAYGFYNRQRGLQKRGPATLLAYDEWAWDLTPGRAVVNTAKRCWSLMQRSLGVVMAASLALIALAQLHRYDDRVLLVALSLLGIVAIHVPFWYEGILGVGYVAEGMPLVLLLAALVVDAVVGDWKGRGRPLVAAWWFAGPLLMIAANLIWTIPTELSPDADSIAERRQIAMLLNLENQAAKEGPILVIVEANADDALHRTLVFNRPTLDGPVLRAWSREGLNAILIDAFPDRTVYMLRFRGFGDIGWRLVRPSQINTSKTES